MPDAVRLRRLITDLRARAQPRISADLIAVFIAGVRVGDAQPAVARFIAQQVTGFAMEGGTLSMSDAASEFSARNALLAEAALKLQSAGIVTGWRNESLSVGKPPLATIERAACRALGITTDAVHLNAYVDSNQMFVARRAAHKQFDPGKYDNLVGGMVSTGESLHQALSREALEEAGLKLERATLHGGRWFQMRRPVPEGLQSEIIHVYDTTLRDDAQLQNQDGEVAVIECRSIDDVLAAIERDEFTLEAALVVLESVTRRERVDIPAGLFL